MDDIAGFHEVGLGNERQFVFDGKLFALGATWTVRGASGRPLFDVSRPSAESVASEFAALSIVPWPTGRRPLRTERRLKNAVEHRLPRTYKLRVPDGRPLGEIRKEWGAKDVTWTLQMADGQTAAVARVLSGGFTDFRVELLDGKERVSLTLQSLRENESPGTARIAAGPRPIRDAWGREVARFIGAPLNSRVLVTPAVYPLYPVFMGVITMYEMDTGR